MTNHLEAPDSGRIVLAGDWHGDTGWMRRMLTRIHGAGHRMVLHVGDLGVLWPPQDDGPLDPHDAALIPGAEYHNEFTVVLCRLLEELGMEMLFIDGNHDNHPALRALPLDPAGLGVISRRLRYIPRGHRFNIGGVRFAGLGGAYSIDSRWRTRGYNWWPEETVEAADTAALGDGPLDVLLTHEVPIGIDVKSTMVLPGFTEALANEGRMQVGDAVRQTGPALVFSGHWHQRLTQTLRGTGTAVHVLDMNGRDGNAAVLDLATLSVSEFSGP